MGHTDYWSQSTPGDGSKAKSYVMQTAGEKARAALAEVGFRPR